MVVPGRLSRAGIQEYSHGYGDVVREYRPPGEVFDDAAMASFDGLTITDMHPESGRVSADTFRELTRGHIQSPRREGDWMIVDFIIGDSELIRQIESGERTELSAGYIASLDMSPGVTPEGERYDAVQRGIRGNHAAVLPYGLARAGRQARLLDSTNNEVCAHKPTPIPRQKWSRRMDEYEVIIDGVSYKLSSDSSTRQVIDRQLSSVKEVVSERDREQARADAADQRIAELEAALSKATDPATLDEAAKVRSALIDAARKVSMDADIDTSGTDKEIMIRALDAAGIRGIEGQSDDYVRARFDARLEVVNTTTQEVTVSHITDNLTTGTNVGARKRFARLAAARRAALAGGY